MNQNTEHEYYLATDTRPNAPLNESIEYEFFWIRPGDFVSDMAVPSGASRLSGDMVTVRHEWLRGL